MSVYFWMREYRKNHSKKILFICFQDLRFEIMQTCPYIDAVIKIDKFIFDYISVYYAEKFQIRRSLLQHFSPHSIEMQSIDSTYGIIEKMRDFLGINPALKIFERYPVHLPQKSLDKAEKLFNDMKLTRGKVVIFLPEGYMFSGFGDKRNFWLNLANRLRAEGYEVLTHTATPYLPGVQNIFMQTFDTSAFLGLCGNIVSTSTGFIESLCAWNDKDKINWTVLLPHEDTGFWKGDNPKAKCEEYIDYYPKFVAKFANKNVKQKCFKWSMTDAEDLNIIEKVVAEIKNN